MDRETKEQWQWKFYRLVLHLNGVVLFTALTIIAILKVPEPYRIAAGVILIIVTALLAITFRNRYHATKAWLDEHGTKKESD